MADFVEDLLRLACMGLQLSDLLVSKYFYLRIKLGLGFAKILLGQNLRSWLVKLLKGLVVLLTR